jgi:uncharacterized membrane protein (DUF2068 family)
MRRFSAAGYFGFKVIGTLKLISGAFSVAAGIGILHYIDRGQGMGLERVVTHLGMDPHNHIIHMVISKATGIDRVHLRAIEAGTFLYALVHLIEGIGLILERDWAGYLVIVATSSLIPFEIYEILQKWSLARIAIFALNLAIVGYLIVVLRAEHRNQADQPT